jgi:hypothetical protein
MGLDGADVRVREARLGELPGVLCVLDAAALATDADRVRPFYEALGFSVEAVEAGRCRGRLRTDDC